MRTSETKTIPLTRGLVTIVDSSDYDILARHKWCAANRGGRFYAARVFKNKTVSMHREITGCLTGFEVDHINGDPLDNRRANLRITDRVGNARNQRMHTDNTSGYKGVKICRWRVGCKWGARIKVGHRSIWLGLFLSSENAAIAYNIAALEHFGEYAVLNIEELSCEPANPLKN